MRVSRDAFEALVAEALETLPDEFVQRLENVEILVEDWPSRAQRADARLSPGTMLLGLYEGVPLTERTHDYGLVPPDKISLFQRSIEALCSTPDEVRDEVRSTVIHEIAHHFGISDRRLDELER